jgi:hypothetical protein
MDTVGREGPGRRNRRRECHDISGDTPSSRTGLGFTCVYGLLGVVNHVRVRFTRRSKSYTHEGASREQAHVYAHSTLREGGSLHE